MTQTQHLMFLATIYLASVTGKTFNAFMGIFYILAACAYGLGWI